MEPFADPPCPVRGEQRELSSTGVEGMTSAMQAMAAQQRRRLWIRDGEGTFEVYFGGCQGSHHEQTPFLVLPDPRTDSREV